MPAIEIQREDIAEIEYTAKRKLLELHGNGRAIRDDDGGLMAHDKNVFRAHAKLLREVLLARRGGDECYVTVYEMGKQDEEKGDVEKAFCGDERPLIA